MEEEEANYDCKDYCCFFKDILLLRPPTPIYTTAH